MKASTIAIKAVTKERILAVLAECNKLGETTFLKTHGYRPSLRYKLHHEGKLYPSKAVLGVAAGITPSQFSGGASHTARVLLRLGFEVADTKNKTISSAMTALVAIAAAAWPFPALAKPSLPIEPVAAFASGSNNAGEIRGWAALGHDVGAAAPHVNAATERELVSLRGQDIAVFIDSGAFGEMDFTVNPPQVKSPMTREKWDKVIGLYGRLASELGPQLHVVAPDKVGDQMTTLVRLDRYKRELQAIGKLGAHVLVPVQKGSAPQAEFMTAARELLRMDCVPSLPCKKAATTPKELRAFCRDYQPTRLHLLGLGTRGKLAQDYLSVVAEESPDAQVTLDSCVITAHCGSNRRIGIARKIAIGIQNAVGKTLWTVAQRKEFELLLAFGLTGGLS